MVTIVNYGMGNVGSIQNMLKKLGEESICTSDPQQILDAEKLILPGVGAFAQGMRNLYDLNLIEPLNKAVLERKTPVLGICLGMQLLTKSSEEGGPVDGLGYVDARTIRFNLKDQGLKVPHMGWNTVTKRKDSPLILNAPVEQKYYFVHSYYVTCAKLTDILLTAYYGIEIVAAFANDNVMGCQFHPEKSHKYGMNILSNFVNLY